MELKMADARTFEEAKTTWTGSHHDLTRSADFVAVSVQGVATVHRLYALVGIEHTTYVYAVLPDGGPVSVLSRMATERRTFQAWEVPFGADSMPLMLRVHQHIVREAMEEVADEYAY